MRGKGKRDRGRERGFIMASFKSEIGVNRKRKGIYLLGVKITPQTRPIQVSLRYEDLHVALSSDPHTLYADLYTLYAEIETVAC